MVSGLSGVEHGSDSIWANIIQDGDTAETDRIPAFVRSGDIALVSDIHKFIEMSGSQLTLHSMRTWKHQTQAALIAI